MMEIDQKRGQMHKYLMVDREIAFQKRWDHLVSKIEKLDPDALEEFENILSKLNRLYASSSAKVISKHFRIQDEYLPKLEQLHHELALRIDKKFMQIHKETLEIIGDPDTIKDIEKEHSLLQEATDRLRLLAGFHHRWKHRYHTDRLGELRILRDRVARKHTTIMHKRSEHKKVATYKEKLNVLETLKQEADRVYDWYCSTYLNLDSNNRLWHGKELPKGVSWIPVEFFDTPTIAPLEPFRKIPHEKEIKEMEKLFAKFLDFYMKHDILTTDDRERISEYESFLTYSEKFSLDSEDPEDRLKAALLAQLSTFHTVMKDAKARHEKKQKHENTFELSFAAYFAPIDEIYKILLRGHISSEDSIKTQANGLEKGTVLDLFPHIHHGDIGFIFPVTKIASKHLFTQLRDKDKNELHIYNKDPEQHVKIDIRDGVFIAPKDKTVSYILNDSRVEESYEIYFHKFFYHLKNNPHEWFDPSRTEGWLRRHCMFYTDEQRKHLLQLLESKSFVSLINRFTNRQYDNLAFHHLPGTISPTEHHKFYEFNDHENVSSISKMALTLFEWKKDETE